MMLRDNLARIIESSRSLPHVLDVGGAAAPLNTATHILDAIPYSQIGAPLAPDEPVRHSEAGHIIHDLCSRPWPFPDNHFDFAFCVHTLEDVRDPIGACHELKRVARGGYIEVPSRLCESFHRKRGYLWRRLVGRPIRVGYGHHRWLCELRGSTLTFIAKPHTMTYSAEYFITREEFGRDLTLQEANVGFFWTQDSFGATEQLLINPGETESDLVSFKQRHLAERRNAPAP